ncbi:MAG TPA: hemerythrin domain-containing protein [Candidatus Limnocylindrales bacterium]|nr:hemerythrin domain-containing protein [Candidatus Limnocylindrales bacterium]
MDAITLLKQDHRKVDRLFEEIKTKQQVQDRERLFNEIRTELTVHATIEEKLFYPAVQNARQTHEKILESYEEHKQVKMVLADLAEADKSTENWMAGLTVLLEDVQHHVKEEEEDIFPKVREKILSEQELDDLGARMQQMKEEQLATA